MDGRLEKARKRIDALDRAVARLLDRRFALAAALGPLKKKARDPRREARVLANISRLTRPGFRKAARAAYAEIIKQSRLLQGRR
ncbi:MAG: chorismate mutase [Elusimicrobiales bacterium]|jgi:chorismate mutase|nr:chorismate mutase [Elusimicrobiales bacterium]